MIAPTSFLFSAPRVLIGACLLASAGALFASGPALAPLPEEVFPQLKDILQTALKQSPTMLQRNIEVMQAEGTYLQNRAGMLPNLSGSVSYTENTSAPTEATSVKSKSDGVFYSVSLNQPLFHWGSLKAQSDAGKIGVLIAEKNYAEGYRTLALSLRSQYMALVVGRMAMRNAEFSLQVAEKALAIDEQRLKSGVIAPGDIIATRLAVNDAMLARDRAQEAFLTAKNQIVRLAGIEAIDESAIPDSVPREAVNYVPDNGPKLITSFRQGGVELTPAAESLALSVKQADMNYKVQKYRLYPKLSLSASVSQSNSTSATATYVSQVGVLTQMYSVNLSWNIFDGFSTRGGKMSALASKRTYERLLENHVAVATEQARSLERQVAFAYRAMDLANVRRDLTASAVNRAKQDIAIGVGSQNTIDTLTASLNSYELVAASARAEFLNRSAELMSLVGGDPMMTLVSTRHYARAKQ